MVRGKPVNHILQNNDAGYVYADGVESDLDQSLTDDFGQWPAPGPDPVWQLISNQLNGIS